MVSANTGRRSNVKKWLEKAIAPSALGTGAGPELLVFHGSAAEATFAGFSKVLKDSGAVLILTGGNVGNKLVEVDGWFQRSDWSGFDRDRVHVYGNALPDNDDIDLYDTCLREGKNFFRHVAQTRAGGTIPWEELYFEDLSAGLVGALLWFKARTDGLSVPEPSGFASSAVKSDHGKLRIARGRPANDVYKLWDTWKANPEAVSEALREDIEWWARRHGV